MAHLAASIPLHHLTSTRFQEEFKKEVQSRTQQTFYPATNLEEGVTYFFAVWAETSAGRGTEVTGNVTLGPNAGELLGFLRGCVVSVKPPVYSDGPPAPTRPSLTPGPSSVSLEWKDAKRNGITGHLIQAKLVSKVVFERNLLIAFSANHWAIGCRRCAAEEENEKVVWPANAHPWCLGYAEGCGGSWSAA